MRRRTFIAGLASAAAWPLVARARQPSGRRPLIAMLLMSVDAAAASPYMTAFSEGMQKLAWIETRDYDTVYRYSGGDATLIRSMSGDLVHLGPRAARRQLVHWKQRHR